MRDGFNPRTRFDEAALDRLAADHPRDGRAAAAARAARRDGDGEFELVDGERRYRAAFQAGLTEMPVLIRPREAETGGLIGALTANFHRAAAHAGRGGARVRAAARGRADAQGRQRAAAGLARARPRPAGDPRSSPRSCTRASTTARSRWARSAPSPAWRRSTPSCRRARCGASRAEPADVVAAARDVGGRDRATRSARSRAQYGDETAGPPGRRVRGPRRLPAVGVRARRARPRRTWPRSRELNPAYAEPRRRSRVRFDRDAIEQADQARRRARLRARALGADRRRGRRRRSSSPTSSRRSCATSAPARAAARARRRDRASTRAPPDGAAGAPRSPRPRSRPRRAGAPSARPSWSGARAAVAFNLELGVAVLKAFAKIKLDARVLSRS